MSRYIGNYLRVPGSEPQQASAPGIWSLSDQLAYQRANLWPPARDPYYNQTVLHLSGDVAGTRETNPVTQPRTFLSDASSNNFLLTPNGDVSARPFSPYASSYSNYFNGSSSYLSLSNTVNLRPGTSDFTTEFWIYRAGPSGGNTAGTTTIWGSQWSGASPSGAWILYMDSTFKLTFAIWLTSIVQSTSTINTGQWYHIAITRSGTTFKLFVNGNLESVGTSSLDANNSVYSILIGLYNDPGISSGYFNGYLSNLRFVKGTALYTTNFTPSLTPLTAVPGTQLLTCQSNRFIDTSSNAFTVTPNGSPAIAQNSPFVEYDTTSGSGYFDGSDWLSTPDNAAYTMGAGDFTVEAWVYCTAADFASSRYIIAQRNSSADTSISFAMNLIGGGTRKVRLLCFDTGGASYEALCASDVINLNEWTHIAGVRNGTTLRIYVNGVQQGTANISTASLVDSDGGVAIGRLGDANFYYWLGYISNVRVTKGGCLYPSGTQFPPPTAPLTTNVSAGTVSLLTLQTRAPANNQGILDTGPNNFVVTRTGNVAQGSFSPFSASGWSNYFGGSPDFLSGSGQLLGIGSNDFTVEAWVFLPRLDGVSSRFILGTSTTTSSPTGIYFSINTNGGISSAETWGINVWNTTGLTFTVGTWNHVALCRSGNTARAFLNGVQATNTGSFSETYTSTSFVIGRTWTTDAANSSYMIGNISNLRVISGQALYSGNFTPPTRQLSTTEVGSTGAGAASSITGTVTLLTCQDNRFRDNSRYNRTISVGAGTPSVQPFSQFAPTQAYVASQLGGSAYFDSSGDSLTIPSAPALNMTGDFCMEAWAYPTTAGISFAWKYTAGVVSTSEYFWAIDGTNQLSVALDGGGGEDYFRTAANTITLNAWNHCVITRVGTAVRQFINGVLQSYNTTSRTLNTTSTNFSTSANSGYISGLRIMRNSIPDIYQTTATTTGTTIFTPPTTPVISVPGTSLLLNFTGAGIVDASGKNNLETVNNICVTTNQAKFDYVKGGASIQFDGNLDQLTLPTSQLYALGTGNFTIELWAYSLDSGASLRSIIDFRTATTGTNGLMLRENSGGFLVWTNSGTVLSTTTGRTANTWQHIALVRASGVLSLYVDGLFQTSVSYTTNLTDSLLRIGGFVDTAASPYGYYGSISNIRITKAARYSGTSTSALNFPLPTGSFPLG